MSPGHILKPDSDGDGDTLALRAAAEWRARHDAGLTAGEQEEFLRWLGGDPRHAELFEEMGQTWSLLDRVRELPETALPPPAFPAGTSRPDRSRRWLAAGLAAAAALAVAAWFRTPPLPADDAIRFTEAITAEQAVLRRIDLPDGSIARIRAGAAIAVSYERDVRRIRLLRGEAHFTVAPNPARPFVVEAGGVGVRAVGTAFSVSSRTGEVEVLVTEGKVRLETAGTDASPVSLLAAAPTKEEPVLRVGQKAVITIGGTEARPATAKVEQMPAAAMASALSWREHMLAYDATPLAEIVAEFNRHNHHQLVIAGTGLGSRRFGGSFRADDPEGFVTMLAAASDLVVEKEPGRTVLRSR